jgi:hypothetical protein
MDSFIVKSHFAKNKSTKLTKSMYSLCRLAYDTVYVLYINDEELLMIPEVTRNYGSINQMYKTIFSDIETNLKIAYSATADICKSYTSFFDITTIACTSKDINGMINGSKIYIHSNPFEIFISQYYNFNEWITIKLFIEGNINKIIALKYSSSCIQTLLNNLRSIFMTHDSRIKQYQKMNKKLFEINRGLEDISNDIKKLSVK